jgi:hypothetical protein
VRLRRFVKQHFIFGRGGGGRGGGGVNERMSEGIQCVPVQFKSACAERQGFISFCFSVQGTGLGIIEDKPGMLEFSS